MYTMLMTHRTGTLLSIFLYISEGTLLLSAGTASRFRCNITFIVEVINLKLHLKKTMTNVNKTFSG